ncbi:unnamed protein product, partial [marine sediment metagenome]
MGFNTLREYEKGCSRFTELDAPHNLITTDNLDWPCYDVLAFHGQRKEVVRDVPRGEVMETIDNLRKTNSNIGVIGVMRVGINEQDASLIAECGVG